jgi:hypothetical protein
MNSTIPLRLSQEDNEVENRVTFNLLSQDTASPTGRRRARVGAALRAGDRAHQQEQERKIGVAPEGGGIAERTEAGAGPLDWDLTQQ